MTDNRLKLDALGYIYISFAIQIKTQYNIYGYTRASFNRYLKNGLPRGAVPNVTVNHFFTTSENGQKPHN